MFYCVQQASQGRQRPDRAADLLAPQLLAGRRVKRIEIAAQVDERPRQLHVLRPGRRADVNQVEDLQDDNLRGAIGGGVITYSVNGTQKVAVAKGLTEILWPTEITTAKVSILGLE
jgi:hypothetical protein